MSTKLSKWACGAAALLLAPIPAAASQGATAINAATTSSASQFATFGREQGSLWIRGGSIAPEADLLVDIIRRADLDGMESAEAVADQLEDYLQDARSGDRQSLARADAALSSAWVEYVQTLRRPVDVGMVYADLSLAPAAPSEREILNEAASAASLRRHLETVSSHNPLYSKLREGLAALKANPDVAAGESNPRQVERLLRLNMDRARMLPATRSGRYVVVDAASQRLWMYEDGRVQDSMRVVVGKPEEATPMLAGSIHSAVLNPYWNVPPDLVQKRIAPNVLDQGMGYLRTKGYEVLSGWTPDAEVLDPEDVDWAAVAAGREELRVRQRPGDGNAMGDMKFMFNNQFGVYLHDTPDKALFTEDERAFSAGCVRLEDAPRLAEWLLGEAPRADSSRPEAAVALAERVPVYITYLTAAWDGERLALQPDLYGRDKGQLRTQMASAD